SPRMIALALNLTKADYIGSMCPAEQDSSPLSSPCSRRYLVSLRQAQTRRYHPAGRQEPR
ncbi:MAG: hypothetical protein WD627_10030, partial [Actinomycetota bacterium]